MNGDPAVPKRKSMLVISVPKSGTVFMNTMFRKGLSLQNYIASNQYFPDDQINLDVMPAFGKGGHYATAHINLVDDTHRLTGKI